MVAYTASSMATMATSGPSASDSVLGPGEGEDVVVLTEPVARGEDGHVAVAEDAVPVPARPAVAP